MEHAVDPSLLEGDKPPVQIPSKANHVMNPCPVADFAMFGGGHDSSSISKRKAKICPLFPHEILPNR